EPIDPGPPPTTAPPAPPTTGRPPETTRPPDTVAPPSNVELVLAFDDGGGDTTAGAVTVNYGWRGRRQDCPGAVFNSAWADVNVAGTRSEFWGEMLARG